MGGWALDDEPPDRKHKVDSRGKDEEDVRDAVFGIPGGLNSANDGRRPYL